MAVTELLPPPIVPPPARDPSVTAVGDADLSTENSNETPTDSAADSTTASAELSARPAYVYTRPQLVFLHKSPLVTTPTGMPALKDWFGYVKHASRAWPWF
jgi:hypothetical protein